MTLTVSEDVFQEMLTAARAAAPLEACGLLAGTGEHATTFFSLANADASPEHYSMRPEEQFAAVKAIRRAGLRLLAIWHSHPATPARMSEEDLRLAYTPDVAYVIVSLAEPDRPQMRAFELRDASACEIEIVVEGKEAQAP